jgi:hypothetical protein
MFSSQTICYVPYSSGIQLCLSVLSENHFSVSVIVNSPGNGASMTSIQEVVARLTELAPHQLRSSETAYLEYVYPCYCADRVLPFLVERSATLPTYTEAMSFNTPLNERAISEMRRTVLPYTRFTLQEMSQAVAFPTTNSCPNSRAAMNTISGLLEELGLISEGVPSSLMLSLIEQLLGSNKPTSSCSQSTSSCCDPTSRNQNSHLSGMLGKMLAKQLGKLPEASTSTTSQTPNMLLQFIGQRLNSSTTTTPNTVSMSSSGNETCSSRNTSSSSSGICPSSSSSSSSGNMSSSCSDEENVESLTVPIGEILSSFGVPSEGMNSVPLGQMFSNMMSLAGRGSRSSTPEEVTVHTAKPVTTSSTN